MVFYYQIRGGPCQGELSHVTLRSQDICCYVGRDKYENEQLIQYGWPGDVWFHVDGLSSAHVYFRLNYKDAAAHSPDIPTNGAIPLDCLPEDSVYDMMQIVKHNSIQGCKMASCKIVWTPHSNLLKKTMEMEAGTVSFQTTKLCRYARCLKGRARIKELEKTKSQDFTDIDFFQQRQDNERAMIDRRKQQAKHVKTHQNAAGAGAALFDPLEADRQNVVRKSTRQGDEQSGLDQGVAALEGLALSRTTTAIHTITQGRPSNHRNNNSGDDNNNYAFDNDDIPLWKQEQAKAEEVYANQDTALFLFERGYPRESIDILLPTLVVNQSNHSFNRTRPNLQALEHLWKGLVSTTSVSSSMPEEPSNDTPLDDIQRVRQEEREVLAAIFGEDIEWFVEVNDNDSEDQSPPPPEGGSILDASIPITTYVPPDRYFQGSNPPSELRLEIYLPPWNRYPFGHDAPILALVGGGIPLSSLHRMTLQLYEEVMTKVIEQEPGDPQLFDFISHVGEIWEAIVQEEGVVAAEVEEAARQARFAKFRAEEEERRALQGGISEQEQLLASGTKFKSEQERHEYAVSIVARGALEATVSSSKERSSETLANKGKTYYNTGVSDVSLIEDLFS